MPETVRWIIDGIIAIVGIIIGYIGKTVQVKVSNKIKSKKTDDHSISVSGDSNYVAGRDINNGKRK